MSVGERPTWSSKKYKNYNEFNKAVLAWKAKQPDPKNPRIGDKKTIPRRRKKGGWTKSYQVIWNGKAWVKKGDPSLTPNRAVPGDNQADIKGYKRAVKTNESLKINSKKTEVKTNNNKNVSKENNKEVNKNNEKEVKTEKSKYPVVTQEQLDKKVAEMNNEKKTEDKGKKESRWIRNPKTKTLVRRTSQKGKQLLKIEERKRKLREKRFGKK